MREEGRKNDPRNHARNPERDGEVNNIKLTIRKQDKK